MCGCVWEKKGLTCYQSDTKCIRAGEYISTQVEHCSTSRCPPRKVREWRWWMWGLLLKSRTIRSILDTDDQKSGSYRRTNCPCDLMMRCASADFTDGTARTSIIRHSSMPMLPSESSICHTNLGTTIHSCMFHILEWPPINACNNEYYAKILTRPHLDTLYFAHDA